MSITKSIKSLSNKVKFRTPKEVYKLWIKALRSGKYKQGKGYLRTNKNEFCCLGVLCDLAAKDGGEQWEYGYLRYIYRYNAAHLPENIKKYLSLSNHDLQNLMEMNDVGDSFEVIANYIEECIIPNKVLQ